MLIPLKTAVPRDLYSESRKSRARGETNGISENFRQIETMGFRFTWMRMFVDDTFNSRRMPYLDFNTAVSSLAD